MNNTMTYTYVTASLSSVGGRKNNQDHYDFVQLNATTGCWVVADGLGGHQGGEVASETLVNHILTAYQQRPACTSEALYDYLTQAQNTLQQAQQDNLALVDMRTTVVVLLQEGDQALWAHSGDSRLYHFRNNQVLFQTKDHSVPQMLVTAGEIEPEEMRTHPDRSRLLRCAGEPGELKATYLKAVCEVQAGDVFLLCSDGFWEYVLESEMETDLVEANDLNSWLQAMETRLLNKASGDYDNYTALAVECQG